MRLVLVTTCTARKAAAAGPRVELRTIGQGRDARARARAWTAALEEAAVPPYPVACLYQGDHWTQSMRALATARRRGFDAELWVVSTGYGLVPVRPDVSLKPYEATFVVESLQGYASADTTEPNAVGSALRRGPRQALYARTWWAALTDAHPLALVGPKTLEALVAATDGPTTFVFVLSGRYLDAVRLDLDRALATLRQDSRAIVLTAGASRQLLAGIEAHAPVYDGDFAAVVGGAMGSLNARAAAWLMERITPEDTASSVERQFGEALAGVTPRQLPPRRGVTDDELIATIARHLAGNDVPITRLHRYFRDELAIRCSVKRFARCFEQARQGR